MAFLTIPGNVKQGSLPFVIDKGNLSGKYQSTDTISGKCNFFSFKPSSNSKTSQTFGLINTFPSSFKQYVSEDISFKMLYDHNEIKKVGKENISWTTLTSSVPSIQIREFLPDSKMDQIFNFFKSFISGFKAATEDDATEQKKSSDSIAKQFGDSLKVTEDPNKGIVIKFKNFLKLLFENGKDSVYSKFITASDVPFGKAVNLGDGYQDYILNFPYIMYNRMIGATTTNIYELPYNPQQLFDTKGSAGWEQDSFDLGGKFSGSIIGKFINSITSNIKIHQSPVWKPTDTEGDSVEFTFQLFNDYSSEKEDTTINNFIMINTMVPNNMWTQYHIYQHSPDLYDIKIDGIKRLYMCACDITVEPKGVLRIPSASIFDRLANKYKNDKYSGLDMDTLIKSNMIRIPDIYEVKLNFKSLLPNNLNNYLMGFSDANNIYQQINQVHTDNLFTKMNKKLSEEMVTAWEKADDKKEMEIK